MFYEQIKRICDKVDLNIERLISESKNRMKDSLSLKNNPLKLPEKD